MSKASEEALGKRLAAVQKEVENALNKANDSDTKIELLKIRQQLQEIEKERKRSPYVRALAKLIYLIVSMTALLVVLYLEFIKANKRGAFDVEKAIILKIISTIGGKFTIAILLVIIASLLFWFKKKQQFYYGIVETIFACVNSYVVADNIAGQSNKMIYLLLSGMTTIYLLVRGLSNISEGWNKGNFAFRDKLNKEGLEDLARKLADADLPGFDILPGFNTFNRFLK
ncbi:hypothetical protein BH09BAC4_BH09BAC4_30520 [soil metagenome]